MSSSQLLTTSCFGEDAADRHFTKNTGPNRNWFGYDGDLSQVIQENCDLVAVGEIKHPTFNRGLNF